MSPAPGVPRPGQILAIAALQDRFAEAIGVDHGGREQAVVGMLRNNKRRAPGYWIQLTLSMGIATLGLVLNSTAVVIGAMLVSPLMGPIVELGMGFAVGSSFLVLRAMVRVFLSVLVVIAGAAVLTLSLPFHEVTGEIAARAAPTALDLLVAVFCALTAAYTTVRSTSETTAAAAGTAIGIALVPPLCAVGFGIGTGSTDVASGAGLLFTANLSAILVFAVISFLLLGFNQVDAEHIENDVVEPDSTRTGELATRAQLWLRRAFGSRYGLAMRIGVPGVVLASVYVPLRHALNEVTWEVRSRDAIRGILQSEAPRAVQTSISVERHVISLHVIIVGSNATAAQIQTTVEHRIRVATGVAPSVGVVAVPDAKSLATAVAAKANALDNPPNSIELRDLRQTIATTALSDWPGSVVGPLVAWRVVVTNSDSLVVEVHHAGPALGPAAEDLVARNLGSALGAPVRVIDFPLPISGVTAALGREREWLGRAQPILDWVAATDGAVACVLAPVAESRKSTASERAAIAKIRESAAFRAGRLAISDSSGWSIRAGGQCSGSGTTPPRSTRDTSARAASNRKL
ncbi:MAG: DUF389 domain-containing protein [Gemmatimonadaceae bacterium]